MAAEDFEEVEWSQDEFEEESKGRKGKGHKGQVDQRLRPEEGLWTKLHDLGHDLKLGSKDLITDCGSEDPKHLKLKLIS